DVEVAFRLSLMWFAPPRSPHAWPPHMPKSRSRSETRIPLRCPAWPPPGSLAKAANRAVSHIRLLSRPLRAHWLLAAAADSVRARRDSVDRVLDQGEILVRPHDPPHKQRVPASMAGG